ncbi:MAG: WYL domain-containing protein [Succinivibrionaceae bacterium]|nr:WYL domain-containing protein [Succinivibrionaceae bacterium]
MSESKSIPPEDTPEDGKVKWNQQRRLEFIDFRIGSEGKLNRHDLVEFFNISIPQASLDISRYSKMVLSQHPPRRNLTYDRHLKVYLRTSDFQPLFPEICSPENYLRDLQALAQGTLVPSRNFFGFVPNLGVAAFDPPGRRFNAAMLYNVLEAIRTHRAVHITYLSMHDLRNSDFLIAPHGLAYDGMRWHVRAYCYDRHAFRDYVLSRIVRCAEPEILAPNDRFPDPLGNGFRESGTSGADDRDWNDTVDLVIRANPELGEAARHAVEFDYGMAPGGTVTYTCRVAMLFYALQWLRLTPEDRALPAQFRQLALDNEREIASRLHGG